MRQLTKFTTENENMSKQLILCDSFSILVHQFFQKRKLFDQQRPIEYNKKRCDNNNPQNYVIWHYFFRSLMTSHLFAYYCEVDWYMYYKKLDKGFSDLKEYFESLS
jgi:hypothetical protein